MGASSQEKSGPEYRTSGIYDEAGMTCLPVRVKEVLGIEGSEDGLVWIIDDDTGEVKVQKNGGGD